MKKFIAFAALAISTLPLGASASVVPESKIVHYTISEIRPLDAKEIRDYARLKTQKKLSDAEVRTRVDYAKREANAKFFDRQLVVTE